MPTLVQSKSGTITSGTSLSLTLGSGTTATDCLVGYIGAVQGTTNPVVSGITLGGAAGNWAAAKAVANNLAANCEIWVDWNCAGGQTAVAITFTAGSGVAQGNMAWAEEWSGIQSSSNPVDKTNGATGTSGTASSGSSGTLTQASELVTGAICSLESDAGPGAPWTNQAQLTAGVSGFFIAGHQVVSATTAQTYSSATTSAGWGAVIVTLKAAAAVQGTVAGQKSKGRASAGPGRVRTAAGVPVPPRPVQAVSKGRAAAVKGRTATVAAKPTPAKAVRAVSRPPVMLARPGRVTVVRSTGAGVAPPPAAVIAPSQAVLDRKPGYWKKRLLAGL